MKLHFPNPSRSFDENKNRVQFWGYDSAIEISFYVEADALKRLCPEMDDIEKSYLLAFDDSRDKIYEIADKLYSHGRKGNYAYILGAKDF